MRQKTCIPKSKTLMKEIKGDANMEKYIVFLNRKNQRCQNDILPNVIYRFSAIPVKSLVAFFIELEQRNAE